MKIDLTDKDTVLCYIREHAFDMLKEGGGVFQYPFINPGAGYDFNLWDWIRFGRRRVCWICANIFAVKKMSQRCVRR